MDKVHYIQECLLDVNIHTALDRVVTNVDALIPQNETEFTEAQKFGL